MQAYRFTRRRLNVGAGLSLALFLSASAWGCKAPSQAVEKKGGVQPADSQVQLAVQGAAATSGAAVTSPIQAKSLAKSSYDEEAFHVVLSAPQEIKSGQSTQFTLILKAKSGYKINPDYPLKFKFAPETGVSPKQEVVRKDQAKIEGKLAQLPLAATVEKPGKVKISGKIYFSVCTDERCLIEKRDLSILVNAS